MICADCGADTRVLDCNALNSGQTYRRRRVCLACGARTTTYEIQAETFAVLEAVFATVHASIGTVKARMPAQRKDSTRRKNRERVARDLEAKGAGITQIAGQMGLHPDTVRRYLSGSVRIEAA